MQNPTQSQSGRTYCSELCAAEPLAGTADTVDTWLLLEYRPVWKARALTDNALAGDARDWIERTLASLAAAGYRARPQFIRRPEDTSERTRLLVGTAHSVLEFSGVGYDFLDALDLAAALRDPAAAAGEGCREILEPLYFVCTNGQRDVCCARFGLPLYSALRERIGARVWQVSHLGGHRFAPNLLALPTGCLYGRVHPEHLDDFLGIVEPGGVDFRRLRGRTRYPGIVQAAEAFLGKPGVRLLQLDGDDREAVVTFADDHQLFKVAVRRAEEPLEVLKSCDDEMPQSTFPYVQIAL